MKKTLSIILAIIMIVNAVPVAFAEGEVYKSGDIIQHGSYPQTKVEDTALLAELNAIAPEWEDWTSYGYYTGSGGYMKFVSGSMVPGDWMRYTDVTYGEDKYRAVKFTQYRPATTVEVSRTNTSYQDDNGYYPNTVYWFKFEPINWRIIDPCKGLVMCETIIDSQPFNNTVYFFDIDESNDSIASDYYFIDAEHTIYASQYETSSIRKWLSEDFYNLAFTDNEKEEIKTTTVSNIDCLTSLGIAGYEEFDGEDTEEKVYLLSVKELDDPVYGFNHFSSNDSSRKTKGSDYAYCQGLKAFYGYRYDGYSEWLLRCSYGRSEDVSVVNPYGQAHMYNDSNVTYTGVRPAMNLNYIVEAEHEHFYSSKVATEATHTTDGVILFTSACGSTYTEIIPATRNDHDYNDDGYCIGCGESKMDNCNCGCHKSGIAKFFFKIMLFFAKIFKNNKVCSCGMVEHY